MAIRPKKYTAVKPFRLLGGRAYETGQEVSGADLAAVLRFGDAFVAAERSRPDTETTERAPAGAVEEA